MGDHDEDCHGTIDSNWARREYPGGFTWTCCGEKGDETKGCTSGKGETISEMFPDSPQLKLKEDKWFHLGDLEPNYESGFWADTDEKIHGKIDTNTSRREYPEGFIWTCCRKIGTYAKGCVGI